MNWKKDRYSSQCISSEKKTESLKKQKQKDIKNYNETAELIRECRRDLLCDN